MNRRQVLTTGVQFAGLAALFSQTAGAQVVTEPNLQLTTVIDRNHGHTFVLQPIEALQLLRATRTGENQVFDIQGQSRHPHSLVISHAQLLALFVDGAVSLVSSEDAGHTHEVQLVLDVV